MSTTIIDEYCDKISELLSQTRVSFLIGAGCSLCAGLPLMDTLTTQICELLNPQNTSDSDKNIAYSLLNDIKERFSSANSVSIEDYLSEIQDIDAMLQRQKIKGIDDPVFPPNDGRYHIKHTQLLLKDIKEAIRDLLGANITTIKYHRGFCKAIHKDLVKGRKRTMHPVNYFMLNYDTLFEDALALESISFNDGFVGGSTAWWDPKRFGGEEYSLGGNRNLEARVYKLHGSIDWIRPQNENFPIRVRASLPSNEIIGDGEPVVIFPSSVKYKETQYDPYAQMMMSFRKYLSETENHVLGIMGYGFNDEHINAEVKSGIINSSGALSVVIFLGTADLPPTLINWLQENRIKSQVLVLGKRGIWKDGEQIYTADHDIEWYKFEYISSLLRGVM